MLQLDAVTVRYGNFTAIDRVDISLTHGEITVLLGANGAGKTTLFKTLSGLLRPVSGTIIFDGRDITRSKPTEIVRLGLVHCPEGRKLFPALSVEKNLLLGAYVHARDKAGVQRALEEVYSLFPILRDKAQDEAGSLSGGQQQMVAIGRALMARPRLLLLDEPSLGLAPLVVKQMFEVIARINASGTTVLLAEQNAYGALKIAHKAYILEQGRIILQGDPQKLLADDRVRRAYIGI
ncbi:ABC transporter ATP-binding protein [Tepidiphilus olei]|uniref:ABC transporter ATP-binding protein n=1 Tax=Tepidiphilus olei TaxID=2502184 RepID=UPI00115CC822|nr:ABC transporter ATP-binding protein [Tepidiphilus olei]